MKFRLGTLTIFIIFLFSCVNNPVNSNYPDKSKSSELKENSLDYKFPEVKGNILINPTTSAGSAGANLFLNNNGDGLIVWEAGARRIKGFLPEGDEFKIGKNFGYSSISLNSKGDGFVVWSTSSELTFGKESASLHGRKVKGYLPIEEEFLISEDLPIDSSGPTAIVNINENGNGFIFWPQNLEYKAIEITNFNRSNKIGSITRNLKSDIYIKFTDDKPTLKQFIEPESQDYQVIRLNNNGNGLILLGTQKTSYIKKVENYNPLGQLINTNSVIMISQASLNNKGKGLIINRFDDSNDLYSEKIDNFTLLGLKTPITNEPTIFRTAPTISLNDNGDGMFIWTEIKGYPSPIYARLVSKFQPLESSTIQPKVPTAASPPPFLTGR